MGQGDRFLNNDRFLGTYSSIPHGAVGSAMLSGDGGATGSISLGETSNIYVFAIHTLAATKFQALENLNGVMGSLSTVDSENQWADSISSGGFLAGSNVQSYAPGASGFEFPANYYIYGKWDRVELHSGRVLAYVAHK